MVATLRAINIYSVEDLADATESDFQRIGPGARDLREKARAWLKVANETGKIAAELKARDDEISALKDALAAAVSDISELRGALDRVQPREAQGGRVRKVNGD
jgi:septal ring factor EnvC (AmiA/AmiB activator)